MPTWEVGFYTEIAPAVSVGLVPVCFDTNGDNATRTWHLLPEDLTDTHVIATTWPLPPTVEQCDLILDARARFADHTGDRPPRARRDLYERFPEASPRLLARRRSRRDVIIVHGDARAWNCFLPRDGNGTVRLFDLDSWRIGIATCDLAYMMAPHWYPAGPSSSSRCWIDTIRRPSRMA